MPVIPKSSWWHLQGIPWTPPNSFSKWATAQGLDVAQLTPERSTDLIKVSFTLPRREPPEGFPSASEILNMPWGERSRWVKRIERAGGVGKLYGADPADFKALETLLIELSNETIRILEDNPDGGINSSPESSTLTATLPLEQLTRILGIADRSYLAIGDIQGNTHEFFGWDGDLRLSNQLAQLTEGLSVSVSAATINLAGQTFAPTATSNLNPADLSESAIQSGISIGEITFSNTSPGNASNPGGFPYNENTYIYSGSLAYGYYKFPTTGSFRKPINLSSVEIALNEPGIGQKVPEGQQSLQDLLIAFQANIGGSATGVQVSQTGSGKFSSADAGERDLDVSVIAGTLPNPSLTLLSGNPAATPIEPLGALLWGSAKAPKVVSSSFSFNDNELGFFRSRAQRLIEDLALAGITTLGSAGDSGSGNLGSIGIAWPEARTVFDHVFSVGGTSLSTPVNYESDINGDISVRLLIDEALQGNQEAIKILGLSGTQTIDSGGKARLVEVPWNQTTLYIPVDDPEFSPRLVFDLHQNNAGSGGVLPGKRVNYQKRGSLKPRSVNDKQFGRNGRGFPDVSALAGGNSVYTVINSLSTQPDGGPAYAGNGGTSASSPLMAAYTGIVNVLFESVKLPRLGYATDLYYAASVVAPSSFFDVVIGNNTTSYAQSADLSNPGPPYENLSGSGQPITPTGLGYEATSGYDLTTGLGSPNGTMLAATLVSVATQQLNPSTHQPLFAGASNRDSKLNAADQGRVIAWGQNLLNRARVTVNGERIASLSSFTPSTLTWDERLAGLSLLPNTATLPLEAAQGSPQGDAVGLSLKKGDQLQIKTGKQHLKAQAVPYTNSFGFVELGNAIKTADPNDPEVRLFQPFSTVNRAPGLRKTGEIRAVLTMRRGSDSSPLQLGIYRIANGDGDLITGKSRLRPGDTSYLAAAEDRLIGGWIDAPADPYGWSELTLDGFKEGRQLAFLLKTGDTIVSSFDTANPGNVVQALGYGLNTYGFEAPGTSNRDFQDLVFRLDFNGLGLG